MNETRLDYLNIGLMLIALIAAFYLPFEVFLISYAILGPLHYLTEISWLHDRQYFSPRKYDYVPLVVLSAGILLGSSAVIGADAQNVLQSIGIGEFFISYSTDMIFTAFGVALVFVLTPHSIYRVIGVTGVVIAAMVFHELTDKTQPWNGVYWSIFALYIPTLIHVYLFTMLFMIYGALKRQSMTGHASVMFMLLCAASCFVILPDTSYYEASEWGQNNYEGAFKVLSQLTLLQFGDYSLPEIASMDIFNEPASVMLGRFIAFAYTYHYLNWFSKTKVIGWHKVPKSRFIAVIVIWLLSVALYFYDYELGFRWLFLLSFAHILLEFPLNHQSMLGIGRELKLRITGAKKTS